MNALDLSKTLLKILFISSVSLQSAFGQSTAQTAGVHVHSMTGGVGACSTSELSCANAATPVVLQDGTVLLVWSAGGGISFAKSKDLGKTWSPAIMIAQHHQFLDTGTDARPQLVADGQGHVLIAYAYFKDEKWNAKINIVTSNDFGEHFTSPKPLINAGESERFPSVVLKGNGVVAISWLDKRLVALRKNQGQKALGASLAYTESWDWGETFKKELILNPQTCECCHIALAKGENDDVLMAYRAIFNEGVRDHAFQWMNSKMLAQPIHRISNDFWQTDVCPHQGPSVAYSGSDVIHVAWFTLGQNRKGLFYANSMNRGQTFSEPMRLGEEAYNPARASLLSSANTLWLVWKEFDGRFFTVKAMHSQDEGKNWSMAKSIGKSEGYADHPQLINVLGDVYVSWLTRELGYRLIKLED